MCDKTGVKHDEWRVVKNSTNWWVYDSEAEAEYPQGLCQALARGIVDRAEVVASQGEMKCNATFVEFFSGPLAPLTAAVVQELSDRAPSAVPSPRSASSASRPPPRI